MEELLKQINKLYGLNVHSFEKVTKGSLSENHVLVEGDKKYFLKRYRFDKKEKIEEVHMAKKYFSDGGIPVILPILNSEGKTFFCFENGYFALFPFINDKEIERGTLPDKAIVSLGEMLGRIHLLGKEAKIPINDKFKVWEKDKMLTHIKLIEAEINKKEILSDFDELAKKNIKMKRDLLCGVLEQYSDLSMPSDHLIHGDYLVTNVFYNDHDEVSFVFDFEKTRYSPRLYELFRSMMYDFCYGEVTEEKIQDAKLYIESYLNIYPASIDELKEGLKFYSVKTVQSLWVEYEHYLKDNNRVDQFLITDFQRVKYLSENFKEFESKLFDGI